MSVAGQGHYESENKNNTMYISKYNSHRILLLEKNLTQESVY